MRQTHAQIPQPKLIHRQGLGPGGKNIIEQWCGCLVAPYTLSGYTIDGCGSKSTQADMAKPCESRGSSG